MPQEENGISISLVGTYRSRDGLRKDVFTRAVFILPEINRSVFPIEEKSLEDFMGILSASSKADAVAPLKVGTYTLDGKASAYIDGDKLFNVMRRYWVAPVQGNLSLLLPYLNSLRS